MDKDTIIKKIEDGKELSQEENLYYLTEIIGHSKEMSERIIAIANNKDNNILMD